MKAATQDDKLSRRGYVAAPIPSRWVEYACYFSLAYSVIGSLLGVEIPFAAGLSILMVAAICILQLRSCAKATCAPVGLLLACGSSFILIQIVMHDASILNDSIRAFINWMLLMITVQTLRLRPGFSRRFVVFLFVLGAIALPYMTFNSGAAEQARIGVETGIGGDLTHPGGLSGWFGFCAIYFAIFGLEARRHWLRLTAWVTAAVCLVVVVLTVERGAIFAAALAITIAFRGLLKRGFVPLLMLIVLAGVLSATGLFDRAMSHYSERGMEESGREILWPMTIERLSESPWTPIIGVGLSQVGMYALSAKTLTPPHNSFLFFILSSGFIPLAFWIAFWIQATWKSLTNGNPDQDDSFRIPYLIFVFVSAMLSDTPFTSLWALLALSVGAGSAVVYARQRILVLHSGGNVKLGILPSVKASGKN